MMKRRGGMDSMYRKERKYSKKGPKKDIDIGETIKDNKERIGKET